MKILITLVEVNFKFAVFLSIAGGLLIYNRPELFFDQDYRLYGPIANNLLIAAIIVSVIQALLLFRYMRNGHREAMAMGCLFILISYDLGIYSDTNQIFIDSMLSYCSFYLGASHVLYFLITLEE